MKKAGDWTQLMARDGHEFDVWLCPPQGEPRGALVIAHEDAKTGGVGAEIAARIAEKAVWELEAPVVRAAGPDRPYPYAPPLEAAHAAERDLVRAVRDLLR